MDIKIRRATESDFITVISLIKEFASFLDQSDKVKITLSDLENNKELFQCIVAENDKNKIIGYALFFQTFHTWTGKALYLEDLFVKEEYRRHSVGSMLIYSLIDFAKRQNCNKLEWQVLETNTSAINFYKKIGAKIDSDKLDCSLKIN